MTTGNCLFWFSIFSTTRSLRRRACAIGRYLGGTVIDPFIQSRLRKLYRTIADTFCPVLHGKFADEFCSMRPVVWFYESIALDPNRVHGEISNRRGNFPTELRNSKQLNCTRPSWDSLDGIKRERNRRKWKRKTTRCKHMTTFVFSK